MNPLAVLLGLGFVGFLTAITILGAMPSGAFAAFDAEWLALAGAITFALGLVSWITEPA